MKLSPRTFSVLRIALSAGVIFGLLVTATAWQRSLRPTAHVKSTSDFELGSQAGAAAWSKTEWATLQVRSSGKRQDQSRFKALYSSTGLYVLMEGADQNLTASITQDFADLWTEDVFEVYLQPDEQLSLYLEYEISPLRRDLTLLIPNLNNNHHGWLPWKYTENRRIESVVTIQGGEQKSGAPISGWRAEIFVPYKLLTPFKEVPPHPGSRWRANFYRVDYDGGARSAWQWAPVEKDFHDFPNFGTLIFD